MGGGKNLISPFLVLFLIQGGMVGVGILNYQREMIKHAGYNAWISVILSGITIHFIIWIVYKMLFSDQERLEVTSINNKCFGKIVGSIINVAIALYFFLGAFSVFRFFVEVIQVWVFPVMNIFLISLIFLAIVYYTVSGGLRSVAGMSFWGMLIPFSILFPMIFYTLKYLHPINLLPISNHSISDLLRSSKSMIFQFMGFEALLIFYPFIQTPAKSQKWAHLAVLSTTIIYCAIIIITFMYFSEGQLHHVIWPTLTMVKIIEIPLIQRVEYIVISVWFLKIVINVSLYLWAACRVLPIKRNASLPGFIAGFMVLMYFFKDRSSVSTLAMVYANIGFCFIYMYIPLLFVISYFIKRMKGIRTG